jgi:thiol-disulfide isomerase/thioredoxin
MTATAALLLFALSLPGNDTVLVQFHSTNCGPCRAMHPVMQRLASEGYPLQQIDVDQQPQYSEQFKIKSLPTFVLFHRSREVQRVEGSSNFAELAQLYHTVGFRPNAPQPQSETQFTSAPAAQEPPPQVQPTQGYVNAPAPGPAQPTAAPAGAQAVAGVSPQQRAAWATVRLKVEDGRGYGFGTGTIIDRHDDEALILTCGHLFRNSQGKGKISVDLFAPGATQPVEGQLIAYDADSRDIALVSIRPGIKIDPVPVAGADYAVAPRDRVFTIGCDKGATPSLRNSQITSVNRYQGAPNFTAEGVPVDGRSGGGLFAESGLLIGVCNAADAKGNEGLYAALATVHWQLDQIGQSAIYRGQAPAAASVAANDQPTTVRPASLETPAAAVAPVNRTPPPNLPATMPGLNTMTAPLQSPQPPAANTPAAAPDANDTEVIVIVRSRSNPAQQSEIFVMDRPAAEIIRQLQAGAQPAPRGGSQDLLRSAGRFNPAGGTIVRGQSQE